MTAPAYKKQQNVQQNVPRPSEHRQPPWAMEFNTTGQAPAAKPGHSKPVKPAANHKSNTSMSSAALNDLYSTFKDDMQKMNERTYFRANGVKVCKVSL